MAKVFLTPINLSKLELQNAVIQNLGSAPSTPVEGQIYYNTGDKNFYIWDGSGWVDLTTQGTSAPDADGSTKGLVQLAGDLAGTAASPQIASGVIVNADINASANIALSKLATDPLARGNHTGTQTASTISDFDTQVRSSRLDQMAAPNTDVSFNSKKITSLADPTVAQDAATKAYVDALLQGLDPKTSVRAATTAAGTLATSFENGDVIDGVTLATNDRILIKDQSDAKENGIFTVNASGAPTRALDANAAGELSGGAYVFVEEGTTNADSGWTITTNGSLTPGTDANVWTQFSGAGQITAGTGLTKTGNTIDVIGTSNRISVAADAIDISSSYVGQTSITTLGTITTGTWTGTDIAVADGGTGSSSAAGARTNLSASGYYSSATHSSGTSISITQATHGLRASRGLVVQVQEESSGDIVEADVSVASSGDITITFAASQSANSKRVTVVG